jgi:hypothetical protein
MDQRLYNHFNRSFRLWIWDTESIHKPKCALYFKGDTPIKRHKVKSEVLYQFNIEVSISENGEFWFTWSPYWSSRIWTRNIESVHESRCVIYFEGDTTYLDRQSQTWCTDPVQHWVNLSEDGRKLYDHLDWSSKLWI